MNATIDDPLSRFDISGKSALIIGGTGTLGSAAARALAAAGCDLTLADRNSDGLAAMAEELTGAGADVAVVENWPDTEANAAAIVDATVEAHGVLDLMFIALGTNDVAYIEDQPFEDWRKVMIANLDTHWLACQAAGRQFAK
ncbi:MAG: SDR family NAD(P)-dependent oxidoreductase, partial [Alphaproteobacteria bacterium]|nr:SDR family NAD(P)-dependent oxidoreductase [Alphaproteobacteria bacterium]